VRHPLDTLRNCPACNGTPAIERTWHDSMRIYCESCGAYGDMSYTLDGAATAWNKEVHDAMWPCGDMETTTVEQV
jgi:hypothetical protein